MEASARSQGVILSVDTQGQVLVECSPAVGITAETKQVPFSKVFYGDQPAPVHLIRESTCVEVETTEHLGLRVFISPATDVVEALGTIIEANAQTTTISYSLQGITVEAVNTKLVRGTDGRPVTGESECKSKVVKLLVARGKIVSVTLVGSSSEVAEGQTYTLTVSHDSQAPSSHIEGVIVRLTSRVNIEAFQNGTKVKFRIVYKDVTYLNGRAADQNDLTKGESCRIFLNGDKATAQLLRNRRYCQSLREIEGLPQSVTQNFISLFLNRELPVVFYYAVLETIIRLNCTALAERIANFTTDRTLLSMVQTASRLAGEEYFSWYELEEEVLDNAQHIIKYFAKQLKRSQTRQSLANALHIAVELIDMGSMNSLMYVPTNPAVGPIPLIRIIETSGFHYIMYIPEMLDVDGISRKTFFPERPRTLPECQYPFYYAPPSSNLPSVQPANYSEKPPKTLCCHGQPTRVCVNHCFCCVKCFGKLLAEPQCWCEAPLDLDAVDWAGFRGPCDACKTVKPGTEAAFLECGCFLCTDCYGEAVRTSECPYCLSSIGGRTQQLNKRLALS